MCTGIYTYNIIVRRNPLFCRSQILALFPYVPDCITWIIGDSIIRDAGESDEQIKGGGRVLWKGIGGTKHVNLADRLRIYTQVYGTPTTVVLHVGTCDIFRSKIGNIRDRVKKTFMSIRRLLPGARLIWSDILPRRNYRNEFKPGCGKRTTRTLNKAAHKVIREDITNAHYIRNSHLFNPKNISLFRDDIHLSEAGSVVLRKIISDGLVFFNNNPGAVCFPPL